MRPVPAPLDEALRAGYLKVVEPLASADKKAWWDRYLRGAIAFRGIPLPVLRSAVVPWFERATAGWPAERRVAAATAFLGEPLAEDKVTGVLLLERLVDELGETELEAIAARFRAGQVAEWNTTDWLGIKVLSRVAGRDDRLGSQLLGWTNDAEEPLWLRRVGLVAFVPLAEGRHGGERLQVDAVLEAAGALARDEARFAQTAVGWLLRELSRTHGDAVREFVREKEPLLSREARSMALARLEGRTGSQRRRSR